LLVVESPIKARKIQRILGSDWTVLATVGHILDLPPKELGVNLRTMEPSYETKARGNLGKILTAAKKAKKIVIATDADREGEAIGGHVRDYIVEKSGLTNDDIGRAYINEITKRGVTSALEDIVKINDQLCAAQDTRRILDRIVGYQVSPMLWEVFSAKNLAAGRVQSVALMMLVERERERRGFKQEPYHIIEAELTNGMKARSDRFGGIPTARRYKAFIESGAVARKMVKKKVEKKPPPPCTTADLIKECTVVWGLNSEQTMKAAQLLFQAGRISYHRTDSIRLSGVFVGMAKKVIVAEYGEDYHQARMFGGSKGGGAHEAIRPTVPSKKPTVDRITDKDKKVTKGGPEEKVYEVVWRRAMQSQMKPAQAVEQTLEFRHKAADGTVLERVLLSISGGYVKFNGWYAMAPERNRYKRLTSKGCKIKSVCIMKKWTLPPRRMSERDLIEKMEQSGVGRPSTYASIMGGLRRHEYIWGSPKGIEPTFRGEAVIALLEQRFKHLISPDFTAKMEQALDKIAAGEKNGRSFLRGYQNKRLSKCLASAKRRGLVLGDIEPCNCVPTGSPWLLKVGYKGGPYFACGGECRAMCGAAFDSDGKLGFFRSRKLAGPCPSCKTEGSLCTASSAHGEYILCSSCREIDRDYWNRQLKGEEIVA